MIPIVRARRPGIKLELTPLVDCMFQLIVFFMLTSTFLAPALDLELPSASGSRPPETTDVVVTLTAEGVLLVNREVVAADQLQAAVRSQLSRSDHARVTIRGDKAIRYERFVSALEAIQAAGARQVNIEHER